MHGAAVRGSIPRTATCTRQHRRVSYLGEDQMNENWIIYVDTARGLWDVQEDDCQGAIGSNWQPTTREAAKEFIREMEAKEGWVRGHETAPRF